MEFPAFMNPRSKKQKHELLDDKLEENQHLKAAVLRVAPCVVVVVSLGVSPDMTLCGSEGVLADDMYLTTGKLPEYAFSGQGTIVKCDKNVYDDKFTTIILTTATIFTRNNGVQPQDIEVEVYLAQGTTCKGKVSACDFHCNIALVTVQMDTPVQPPKLRDLDDIMSIHLTDSHPFQLRPHSTLFKIRPGDRVASLARTVKFEFHASFGQFSVSYLPFDCKEMYSISSNDPDFKDAYGSPVINNQGEVIGMIAASMAFIPSNIISRWWNYYKNFKKYCRPCLGFNVANLQSAKYSFLDRFVLEFPNVSSGVIVTKVVENSVAHMSGLRMEDVIVKCNGATVASMLDLFDKIWDKVGAPVELGVLRKAGRMNVKMTLGEATPDNFYRWQAPLGALRPGVDASYSFLQYHD